VRRLGREHDRIDLNHRRLQCHPVDGSPTGSHPLDRLIVGNNERIFAGNGELDPFRVTPLGNGIQGRQPLKVRNRLFLSPHPDEPLEHAVGLGIHRDLSPFPLGIEKFLIGLGDIRFFYQLGVVTQHVRIDIIGCPIAFVVH
jgi:hypothetical protein